MTIIKKDEPTGHSGHSTHVTGHAMAKSEPKEKEVELEDETVLEDKAPVVPPPILTSEEISQAQVMANVGQAPPRDVLHKLIAAAQEGMGARSEAAGKLRTAIEEHKEAKEKSKSKATEGDQELWKVLDNEAAGKHPLSLQTAIEKHKAEKKKAKAHPTAGDTELWETLEKPKGKD